MQLAYPQKLGIILFFIGFLAFSIDLYFITIYRPPSNLRESVGGYGALILSIFLLFLACIEFCKIPQEKVYVDDGENLKIVTKFFRRKERIIPISNIEKAYVGVDMSYKYFIKQSETTEFLTTVIIFKDDGKRIMRFINQNNIVNFNRFVKALKDKGVEVTKISFDIRSQKDFVENVLRKEYKKCDRIG